MFKDLFRMQHKQFFFEEKKTQKTNNPRSCGMYACFVNRE